jgi:hypothetical protein
MKNCQRMAKFLPIRGINKSIARAFNWLKRLGGILHLKPTAGCRINDLMLKSCSEMSEIFPVCPNVDSTCWTCIYNNIFIIGRYNSLKVQFTLIYFFGLETYRFIGR